MNIEQQMSRDELAVNLVVEMTGLDCDPAQIVERAFTLANLTVERIIKDMATRKGTADAETALLRAEAMANMKRAFDKAQTTAAEEPVLEERRKGGGINVIETDDLRELLALFRSLHGSL